MQGFLDGLKLVATMVATSFLLYVGNSYGVVRGRMAVSGFVDPTEVQRIFKAGKSGGIADIATFTAF